MMPGVDVNIRSRPIPEKGRGAAPNDTVRGEHTAARGHGQGRGARRASLLDHVPPNAGDAGFTPLTGRGTWEGGV